MNSSCPLIIAQHNLRCSSTFRHNIDYLKEKQCFILAASELPRSKVVTEEDFIIDHFSAGDSSNLSFECSSPLAGFVILDRNIRYSIKHHSPFISELFLLKEKITIFSIYIPVSASVSFSESQRSEVVERVCDLLATPKNRTLVLGDLNAHSTLIGSPSTDNRGSLLEAFLRDGNWCVLNDPSTPTFTPINRTTRSFIDWSICSSDLAGSGTWTTGHDFSKSDHSLILISLSTTSLELKPKKFVDFDLLHRQISSHLDAYMSDPFTGITSAVAQATRLVKPKFKQPWYNEKCAESKRTIKSICDQLKSKSGPVRWLLKQQLERANLAHVTLVRAAKEAFEAKKLSSYSLQQAQRLTVRVNSRHMKKVSYVIDSDGSVVNCPDRIHSIAMNHFFPASTRSSQELWYRDEQLPDSTAISRHEVKTSIHFQNHSAPGPDEINVKTLGFIFSNFPELIMKLYNDWYSSASCPELVKHASLVLIYKDPHRQPVITNLRPVSLTSMVLRVYERIILHRIHHFISLRSELPSYQFAHTKNSSSVKALDSIQDYMQSNAKNYGILAMDISNAFNNIRHQAIISGYERLKIPSNIIRIVGDLLTNRSLKLKDSSCLISPTKLHTGIFQGAILSPCNFNTGIIESINNFIASFPLIADARLILYADDVHVLFSDWKDNDHLCSWISFFVSKINECLNSAGLKIAVHKTHLFVPFRVGANFTVAINELNSTLRNQQVISILGIKFDGCDNFPSHRKHVLDRAKCAFAKICPLVKSRSLAPKVKRQLLVANVYSILGYGAHIYLAHLLDKKSVVDILTSFDAKMARCMFSLPCNISKAASLSMLYPTSIVTYLKERCLTAHITAGRMKLPNLPPAQVLPLFSEFHPSVNTAVTVVEDILDDEAEVLKRFNLMYFSDASQSLANGGSHCFIDKPKLGAAWALYEKRLGVDHLISKSRAVVFQSASVAEVELFAIHLAVQNAINKKLSGLVLIASDSRSSITSLSNPWSTNERVRKIQSMAQHAKDSGLFLRFAWVKAHCGITGNCKADNLAKSAVASKAPLIYLPLSKRAAGNYARYKFEPTFDTIFQRVNGECFKSCLPTAADVIKHHRKLTSSTVRILSFHGPFLVRLNQLDYLSSDVCECGERQTLRHILLDCNRVKCDQLDDALRKSTKLRQLDKDITWDQFLSSDDFITICFETAPAVLGKLRAMVKRLHPDFNFPLAL